MINSIVITAVDTTGIQDYVFGSNSLQHIIGGSYLVHAATHEWVYEVLNDLWPGQVNLDEAGKIDRERKIEADPALQAELVYSGGGNAVILMRSLEAGHEFTRQLTRLALERAPGLSLAAASLEVPWRAPFGQAVQGCLALVARRKLNRPLPAPLMGLGVTADCVYTGLPAFTIDHKDEDRRVSAEAFARRAAVRPADERLHNYLPADLRNDREFVYDFNAFGEDTARYLAVVHTDGNGMGARVEKIAGNYLQPRDYIDAMRTFSDSVEDASLRALSTAALAATFAEPVVAANGEEHLPFRPLVFGGDDTTFVCSGKLGLPLAHIFLQELTDPEQKLSDGLPLTGRAGVAIVPAHYPFSQAYRLADELQASAKDFLRSLPEYGRVSAIDWHISTGAPLSRLESIRAREYTVPAGRLNMRPVHLGGSKDWRSWQLLEQYLADFRSPDWATRRSQLKALRDTLRQGPQAVQAFLHAFKLPDLPAAPGIANSQRLGWAGQVCTAYDAIEALEFFTDLRARARTI